MLTAYQPGTLSAEWAYKRAATDNIWAAVSSVLQGSMQGLEQGMKLTEMKSKLDAAKVKAGQELHAGELPKDATNTAVYGDDAANRAVGLPVIGSALPAGTTTIPYVNPNAASPSWSQFLVPGSYASTTVPSTLGVPGTTSILTLGGGR